MQVQWLPAIGAGVCVDLGLIQVVATRTAENFHGVCGLDTTVR
jgi:hypothetical protein